MIFFKSLSRDVAQFFLIAFGFKANGSLCHSPVSLIHGRVLRKRIFPPRRGFVPLYKKFLLGGVSLLFLFPQSAFSAVSLSLFVGGLSSPVYLTHAGDFSGRIFVVEKEGRIRIIKNGVLQATPFLDITSRVLSDGERGLLSVAFPPNYVNKGYFYVYYTNLSGNNTIARFSITSDSDVANPNSEFAILTINHPNESNHNGGQLAFGPDGYLYIGTGDGGGGGDPNNNAQNKNVLLGKILRLDVESLSSPYAPSTNPFFGAIAGDDRIWAYGLRNPWRFSFDRQTGDLYIGDVGQGDYEEIDFQAAGIAGGQNYGWRIWEGLHCFNPSSGCTAPASYVPPVFEYNHDQGDCSLTGGFVYRGQIYPNMQGTYFYADFCTGKLWGLKKVGNNWQSTFIVDSPQLVSSFGQDQEGNIYLMDLSTGEIFKIVESTVNPAVSLSVNPTKRTITGGASTTYTVSISRTSFPGNVDLNVSGLPTAASGNFSPDPTNGNSSTLTLDTSLTNTPAGTYSISIGATGSAITIDPIAVSLTINIPDSDNDGLNDQEEAQLGTNPNDSDSDDDTYNDGQEVGAGTNPLSGSSFPGTLKITADNQYVLYVNGVQVGANSNWPDVESYLVNTDDELDIAVDATNQGGPAGVACQITHGSDKHVSDFTWQVSNALVTNWQNNAGDHSTWVNATEYGAINQTVPPIPWGTSLANQFTTGVKWIWSSSSSQNKTYFWTKYNPGQNAVIKATADNILEIYNDEGDLIGQGSDWTKVIYVPEKIESGDAIGLHGQDIPGAGGLGGILAEILYRDSQGNIQRLVTDTNWKYSTSLVSGWTDDDFDDSSWGFASSNGSRGVAPWGNAGTVGNISNLAQWLWSTHNGDQTDDNDVWVRRIVPNATLNISCDNQCTVYVNGNPKGSLSDWSSPKSIGLNLSNGDVIAVQGTDLGGLAGILASLSYNNSTILTNSSWKVTNQFQPDLDWTTEGFDDSGWASAESYGSNGVLPWGTLNSISSQAQWIWTQDRYNDDTVYFRYVVGQSNNAAGLTTLRVAADDSCKFYFNGEFLAAGNNWKQSKEIQLELTSNDVIAIEGNDSGFKAGLLVQTSGAFTLNTDTTWKRLAASSAPADWNTQGFDDSAWANASSYGAYGASPWGTAVAGITTPTTAQWIWSNRNQTNTSNIDHKVFFRKRVP